MYDSAVAIHVDHADALLQPADLLVLKYAQYLYGVDRAAVGRLGVDPRRMPREGFPLLVPGGATVGADDVLFLGVPPLDMFLYPQIREFGLRALELAAELRPNVREVAMTIHGPGYGLDEVEAFESQVGGVLDAIISHRIPKRLRAVRFLERDERRAQRLGDALARLIPGSRVPTNRPLAGGWIDDETARHLRSVGYDAQQKKRAFVAMPFANEFVDVFHFGIAAPIRDAGLLCERMDTVEFVGDIVSEMTTRIGASRLVVADLTTNNPNVYLEVGYAWGRNVPTVLLCRDSHELTFDVRGQRCLRYKNIVDLAGKLTTTLSELLAEPARD